MNCGCVTNQLSAYLDRELTGAEMLRIRSHLGECAACQAEYDGLAHMKSLLGQLRTVEPQADSVGATLRRYELAGIGGASLRRIEATQVPRSGAGWLGRLPGVLTGWLGVRPESRPAEERNPARHLCERIPWSRVSLGLATGTMIVVLAFTCVILRRPRHPDALVASTPAWVIQGGDSLSQDSLGLPSDSERQSPMLPPRLLTGGDLPGSPYSLHWVPASLDREMMPTFR